MPGERPELRKKDLFTRLAEGHAAGLTVVTPNNRLAQSLRAEFDAFQAGKGLQSWEDADILPLDAFVARSHENAIYADEGAKHPLLLSEAQAQALWESIVRVSGLLAAEENAAETAAECAKAWRLAHQWRIEGALSLPGNDDTQAFARWAAEYRRRCDKEGWTDAARLPDRARSLFEKKPKLLVAYGFDVLPPQSRDLVFSFEAAFSGPERRKASPCKALYPSARAELEAAARWARGRVERGAKRVGLVVPRLESRFREVERAFARVGVPVDVSFRGMLADYPIVAFALSLLEFSQGEISFEKASRLIRSPFLADADRGLAARARLDARLRRRIAAQVSLPKLIAQTDGSLRSCLERIFTAGRTSERKNQAPSQWAQVFTSILDAAGFPGDRAPDSAEYQTRVKLNEILGDFSGLTLVSEKLTGEKAIQKLQSLCADTLFQPEAPQAPVQVLGVLESAGLEFDALWVSGLTEEAWPLKPRPHPFLPLAAQRKARIPQASAEDSLAFDRRITGGWAGAAAEVVFSAYEKEEDRELLPSVLIAGIPAGQVEVPEALTWRDLIFQARKAETLLDERATPVKDKAVPGGTRVLADQSACPFRAFARHRLGARALEAPAPAPDARGRGSLLHALMAALWKELGSSSALSKDLEPAIRKAAQAAVKEARIEGGLAALELERLARLARDWLELERLREPFEVIQIEEEKNLQVGALSLRGRIDRLDRLADGSHALIDYKTGEHVTANDWEGPRPVEPQMTIYATGIAEPVGAVAFAKLKAGDMKFSGFSRAKGVIPKVKKAEHWPGLLEGWKKENESLARRFAAGEARVDPKKLASTCRRCDLQPLCRVHERLSLDENAGDEPAEEAE
jgi:probable DNA repair protein